MMCALFGIVLIGYDKYEDRFIKLFYTADIAIAIVSNCNISIDLSTYLNSLSLYSHKKLEFSSSKTKMPLPIERVVVLLY